MLTWTFPFRMSSSQILMDTCQLMNFVLLHFDISNRVVVTLKFRMILFPMIYPTLFQYGKGGFEDHSRQVHISMKHHVKHLCGLSDRRFQEHYSFLFTAFNILQCRSILLHTSLKVH